MNKKQMWKALKTPVFETYVCDTCLYGSKCPDDRNDKCIQIPDSDPGYWEWNGKDE